MSNNVAVSAAIILSIVAVPYTSDRAAAQAAPTPYTPKQCDQIRDNILGIFRRYDGKLSAELVADLKQFSRTDCDRSVKLRMMGGTRDSEAVAELKVLIAAQ